MTIPIQGLGTVPYYQANKETTSTYVQDTYDTNMGTISSIFNQTTPLTTENYQQLQQAIDALNALVQNGDTTTPGGPYSCTQTMLNNIGSVFSVLQAAGFSAGSPYSDPNTALTNMQALQSAQIPLSGGTTTTFAAIAMQATQGVSGSDLTLQSQLLTQFVDQGNEYYMNQLSQLQTALQTGYTVQEELSTLQETINSNVSVPTNPTASMPQEPTPPTPPSPTYTVPQPTLAEYQAQANVYYPNDPAAASAYAQAAYTANMQAWTTANNNYASQTLPGLQQQYQTALTTYQTNLNTYLTQMSNYGSSGVITPVVNATPTVGATILNTYNQLVQQYDYLTAATTATPPGQGQDPTNPGNLSYQLAQVIGGINQAFGITPTPPSIGGTLDGMTADQLSAIAGGGSTSGLTAQQQTDLTNGAKTWLMDGQNSATGGGTYANQVSQAITGSTNFNNTQQDNFNSMQNASNQVYTIAANVLSSLNTAITNIGQNIAG